MGSCEYYIDLKIDANTLDKMIFEYNGNLIYQTAFSFGALKDIGEDGFNAGFSSVVDNFLPATHLIYGFLLRFITNKSCIRANGIKHLFDFASKADFVMFMYSAWETKIDFTYEHFGVLLLDNRKYYKIRNRLYKKHYKKIPRPCLER